jgi:hypothetical protein
LRTRQSRVAWTWQAEYQDEKMPIKEAPNRVTQCVPIAARVELRDERRALLIVDKSAFGEVEELAASSPWKAC